MFSVWQLTPLFYGKIESSVVLGFLICFCTIIAFGQLDHFIGFILAATSICMFVVSKCSNFFSSFPSLESICRIFPWFGLNLVTKKVREMKEIKFFYHFNSTKPKKKGKHERKKEKERSKTLQDWWRNLELPWTKAWGTRITESMRSNIEIINLVSAQCKWGEFSKKPFFALLFVAWLLISIWGIAAVWFYCSLILNLFHGYWFWSLSCFWSIVQHAALKKLPGVGALYYYTV